MFSFLKQTMKTVMDTIVKIAPRVHENSMKHCQFIELLKHTEDNSVSSYFFSWVLNKFYNYLMYCSFQLKIFLKLKECLQNSQ